MEHPHLPNFLRHNHKDIDSPVRDALKTVKQLPPGNERNEAMRTLWERYNSPVERSKELGDSWCAEVHHWQGVLMTDDGDLDDASGYYERALGYLDETDPNHRLPRAWILRDSAFNEFKKGNTKDAFELTEESITLLEEDSGFTAAPEPAEAQKSAQKLAMHRSITEMYEEVFIATDNNPDTLVAALNTLVGFCEDYAALGHIPKGDMHRIVSFLQSIDENEHNQGTLSVQDTSIVKKADKRMHSKATLTAELQLTSVLTLPVRLAARALRTVIRS